MPDIESLTDFIDKASHFAKDEKGSLHLRYWYRGQARDDWTLTPKLYRGNKIDDRKILHKERHLFRDFRLMSASIRQGSETDEQLYFVAQHYGLPTRLLDWTTNPLIALYFACEDAAHHNAKGEVCMLDVYSLNPSGIATARRPEFLGWIEAIFEWKDNSNKTDETLPIRPEHFDRRITLQQGCFTFHPPKPGQRSLDKKNPAIEILGIPGDLKPRILPELATLNISDFAVYGDLESLARQLSANWLQY
jgi:FRG domain